MQLQKVGDWGNGWIESISKMAGTMKKANAGVQTTITTNPKTGMKFLNLFGNTFPIKDQISGLGFRYFKGTWGMPLEMAKTKMNEIAALGIDTSVLTSQQATAPVQPQLSTGTPEAPLAPAAPQTQTEQTLAKMKAAMDAEIKKAPADERTRRMMEHIDKSIEQIAMSTDEAAKQEFVQSFLAFSSKFYNYSFGNQMLIWIQRPDASYVSGFRQWMEKGRQVIKWDRPITILRPQQNKRPLNEREKAALPPDQQNGVKSWMTFMPTSVYDISDTQPIPDWKNKEGKGPFEPPALKTDSNEQEDQITQLVQAGAKFAQSLGIAIDLDKELEKNLGGYSAGKEIAVNKAYQGMNKFSILVHEMAHEILHRQDDQKTPIKESRQNKEIDAEATAFTVLKHYGYETKSAPQYLALWRGTSETVKARRSNIVLAVRLIIEGINKNIGDVIGFQDEADAPQAAPAPATASWLRQNCKFAQDFSQTSESISMSESGTMDQSMSSTLDANQVEQLQLEGQQYEQKLMQMRELLNDPNFDKSLDDYALAYQNLMTAMMAQQVQNQTPTGIVKP